MLPRPALHLTFVHTESLWTWIPLRNGWSAGPTQRCTCFCHPSTETAPVCHCSWHLYIGAVGRTQVLTLTQKAFYWLSHLPVCAHHWLFNFSNSTWMHIIKTKCDPTELYRVLSYLIRQILLTLKTWFDHHLFSCVCMCRFLNTCIYAPGSQRPVSAISLNHFVFYPSIAGTLSETQSSRIWPVPDSISSIARPMSGHHMDSGDLNSRPLS